MSKQRKSEIVSRFRKCFDTKMTELGFTYQNVDLYQQAFSHPSFINDFNIDRLDHDERLEFLGDAVLELTVSRCLFDRHPSLSEGNLAKMRATIVREPSPVIFANKIGLGEMILLSKDEEGTGGCARPSLISDAFEAFIGALYLDQGLDIVWKLAEKIIFPHVEQNESLGVVDSRTQFQEYVHQQDKDDIIYNLIKEKGPTRHRLFTSEVILQGETVAEDKGKTKRESERRAAGSAYKQSKQIKQKFI